MGKGAAPLGDSFIDVQAFASALVNEVLRCDSTQLCCVIDPGRALDEMSPTDVDSLVPPPT